MEFSGMVFLKPDIELLALIRVQTGDSPDLWGVTWVTSRCRGAFLECEVCSLSLAPQQKQKILLRVEVVENTHPWGLFLFVGTSWKPKWNGLWNRENVYPKFSFLLAVYYWTIHCHPNSQFPLLCSTSMSPGATLGPRGEVCKHLAWSSTLTCWCRFSLLLGGNTRIKISLIRNSNAESPAGGWGVLVSLLISLISQRSVLPAKTGRILMEEIPAAE